MTLQAYSHQSYMTRKRASFFYSVCLALMVALVIAAGYTAYLDVVESHGESLNINLQIIFFVLLMAYGACLYMLLKGMLCVTSHMLLISTLVAVWANMFFDAHTGISQLDTIVFVFASLTLLPMIGGNRKRILTIYLAFNMVMLLVFSYYFRYTLIFSDSEFADFIMDSLFAMILMGGTMYRVFSIHSEALVRANSEIEERKLAESKLQTHQSNLERIIEQKAFDLRSLNNVLQYKNQELGQTLNQLKATQTQLVQREKKVALGTLTSGMSHEINNPLNFILGGYTVLQRYFAEHGSSDLELTSTSLEHIENGISRVKKIVRGLGQLSKDTSTFEEECEVKGILENCLSLLEGQLIQKVTLVKNYQHDDAIILGNSAKLHQLFLILITNAIESIDTEGILTISTSMIDRMLIVCLKDNGRGIEQEHINQVFDPFFTTKESGEGTGLGLSIAQSIIAEHGGDIQLCSAPGSGTSVEMHLPVWP